ncbi:MAG: diphosphomevalonate decarboxylase [Bacteroidales bacterium]|nr:diphosphomevalonate decarboxylase [Bacteroidales bacterium]
MEKDFKLQSGTVTWKSPSNIALVKYWGKVKNMEQIPANPSISMSLSECYTETNVSFMPGTGNIVFFLDGKENVIFQKKISEYFQRISDMLPFVSKTDFTIGSKNTFPHSAGIASSASAMSALALCMVSIERLQTNNNEIHDKDFFLRASSLARRGSGSAARSLYKNLVTWGESQFIPYSSDFWASPFERPMHPVFNNFHDTILIVSSDEKKISSTIGHQMMEDNLFAEARYKQAHQNFMFLIMAIEAGDLKSFIRIVENEALTLHGMMMASNPGYMLMEPNTLKIIKKIQDFREQSRFNLCFTLDAGPNVHVLYPEIDKTGVREFIKRELKPLCESGQLIDDKMGNGPQRINL